MTDGKWRARRQPPRQPAQPQPFTCLGCPRQLGTLWGGVLSLDLRQLQAVDLDREGKAALHCWCGRRVWWWGSGGAPDFVVR